MPIKMASKQLAFYFLLPVLVAVSVSNSLFTVFSSLFMFVAVYSFFKEKQVVSWKNPWFLCIAAYLLLNFLAVLPSEYLLHSVRGAFRTFRAALLCGCAIYVLDSEQRWRTAFRFLVLALVLVGMDALAQGATGMEILRQRPMTAYLEGTKRLTGPYPHANDFSAYLSLMIPFLGLLLPAGRRYFSTREFWVIVGAFGIALSCFVGTYARGAWAAVLFSFFLRIR